MTDNITDNLTDNLRDLLTKNRSYRRFYQDEPIDGDTLMQIIENVRLTPSPSNLQPLQFIPVHTPEMNQKMFPLLKWAGYLTDWPGPGEGEQPTAYIIMLGNRKLGPMVDWDFGIALQTILLTATAKGLGGCAIGNCNRDQIRQIWNIPESLDIGCVIALGKPKEKVVLENNHVLMYY